MRYLYLHGFASGPLATKAQAASRALEQRGLTLERPDLNIPDFAHLTVSAALDAIDQLAAQDQAPISFIASSLGGYIATLWTLKNPERVAKSLLLCPGFGLVERWPSLIGAANFERWRSHGSFPFEDGAGVPTPVHWRFIEDIQLYNSTPPPIRPTRIIHGRQDEVVPYESSHTYAARYPQQVSLISVDDDHRLTHSLEVVEEQILTWLIETP